MTHQHKIETIPAVVEVFLRAIANDLQNTYIYIIYILYYIYSTS